MHTPSNSLERISRLIDAAVELAGGLRKLGRMLGTSPSNITQWKAGERPCPVKMQALMADMTGLDAPAVALHALIESESDPERRNALFRALGKAFQHSGEVASFAIVASACWASRLIDTMCRNVKPRTLLQGAQ